MLICICQFGWEPSGYGHFSVRVRLKLRPLLARGATFTRVALNQAEYNNNYSGLTERYDKAKARLEEVNVAISDKQTRQATIEAFLDEVKRLDGVSEFQPALWYSLADHMMVYSKEDVRVRFKDGREIKV